MSDLNIIAYYEENGTPKTGLTPTIDTWDLEGVKIVNAQTMTEIAGGFYKFAFTEALGYDSSEDFTFLADGGASLPLSDRYVNGSNEINNLSNDIWEELLSDHTTNDTFGKKIPEIGGGLSITGDMMLLLKRMSDNVINKKDLKEFISKLTLTVDSMNQKLESENKKSKETVSKMSESLNQQMSKFKTLKDEQVFSELKNGFKKVEQELTNKDEQLMALATLSKKSSDLIKDLSKQSSNQQLKYESLLANQKNLLKQSNINIATQIEDFKNSFENNASIINNHLKQIFNKKHPTINNHLEIIQSKLLEMKNLFDEKTLDSEIKKAKDIYAMMMAAEKKISSFKNNESFQKDANQVLNAFNIVDDTKKELLSLKQDFNKQLTKLSKKVSKDDLGDVMNQINAMKDEED